MKAALAGDPDTVYWAGSAAGGGELLAALRDAGLRRRVRRLGGSRSAGVPRRGGRRGRGRVRDRARDAAEPARGGGVGGALRGSGSATRPGFDALQAYNGVRALAQAVTQSGKVDRERNSQELAVLDADYTTFLGDAGLSFASDHTIKYDNNIVLKVEGGEVRGRQHAALGRGAAECGGVAGACVVARRLSRGAAADGKSSYTRRGRQGRLLQGVRRGRGGAAAGRGVLGRRRRTTRTRTTCRARRSRRAR